jgi:hypothetical protein
VEVRRRRRAATERAARRPFWCVVFTGDGVVGHLLADGDELRDARLAVPVLAQLRVVVHHDARLLGIEAYEAQVLRVCRSCGIFGVDKVGDHAGSDGDALRLGGFLHAARLGEYRRLGKERPPRARAPRAPRHAARVRRSAARGASSSGMKPRMKHAQVCGYFWNMLKLGVGEGQGALI